MVCFPVEKIGVSLSNTRSFARWVLGAGTSTVFPSNIRRKSCHGITCGDRRKSLRKMYSAISAPTQANVVLTGLEKIRKISFNGFSMKVFPVFAGPTIITFRYFPRPFSRRSNTALANDAFSMPFLSRI